MQNAPKRSIRQLPDLLIGASDIEVPQSSRDKTAVTSGNMDELLWGEYIEALMLQSDWCQRGPDACRKLTRRLLEPS